MKKPFRIVVLASTRGTTFAALLAEMRLPVMRGIEIIALVTNKSDCGAAEKAELAGIPVISIAAGATFHAELLAQMQTLTPDLICCMGYMRILDADFCTAFQGKILNVHPSLLPRHAGLMGSSVHEAVLNASDSTTGMTIHLVTPTVDAGPIICQKELPVAPDDTSETLAAKVQELEKKWYPEVIRWFRDKKIVVR